MKIKSLKVILTALLVSSSIFVTSCNDDTDTTNTTESESISTTNNDDSGETTLETSEETDIQETNPFEQFKKGLDSLEIQYEEVVVAAEMVGAVKGAKYKVDDNSIELYQFDKNSDDYIKAVENSALTLEGFGDFPVLTNDGMVLPVDALPESYKDEIINLFNSLK